MLNQSHPQQLRAINKTGTDPIGCTLTTKEHVTDLGQQPIAAIRRRKQPSMYAEPKSTVDQ